MRNWRLLCSLVLAVLLVLAVMCVLGESERNMPKLKNFQLFPASRVLASNYSVDSTQKIGPPVVTD